MPRNPENQPLGSETVVDTLRLGRVLWVRKFA